MAKTYFRVDVYGGGPCWESAKVFSSKDPNRAFTKALAYVVKGGFASSISIEQCSKQGDALE